MATSEERGGFRGRIVDDYAGNKLYDERGEKIGKVEYTVLDSQGNPEYLAVKTGWFGSNTTLLPESLLRPGDRDQEFEVQASEDRIKDAPTFDNEDDVDSNFENRVREYFGVGGGASSPTSSPTTTDTEHRDAEHRDSEYRDEAHRETENRDSEHRDSGYRDAESREREGSRSDDRRTEGRGDGFDRDRDDLDRDLRDDRSRDDRSSSDARDAAVAGGAAASMSRDSDRGERRSSSETSGGGRERVRVTLKRERARAERVIGEDGQEEVRIRKEMVEEEEMVEVEDRV